MADETVQVQDTVVAGRRREFTRAEQRELGLLPRQVLAKVATLKDEGVNVKGLTHRELAQMIAADGMVDDPTTWGKVVGVDWDAILSFIERLLAILAPLFGLL